jgi:hypothetical protein
MFVQYKKMTLFPYIPQFGTHFCAVEEIPAPNLYPNPSWRQIRVAFQKKRNGVFKSTVDLIWARDRRGKK